MDNEERRKMGLAGRRKMEREFNRKLVVEAYMEELEKV
jgi:galacturonosyltransferase